MCPYRARGAWKKGIEGNLSVSVNVESNSSL